MDVSSLYQPTIRFAESPGQYLNRIYNAFPQRSHSQQAFILYFSAACTGFISLMMWNHSERTRKIFNHRAAFFIAPSIILPALVADRWISNSSRRSYQEMHRYDLDWRNMPTGV